MRPTANRRSGRRVDALKRSGHHQIGHPVFPVVLGAVEALFPYTSHLLRQVSYESVTLCTGR